MKLKAASGRFGDLEPRWIEFTRSADALRAKLSVVFPDGPKAAWRVRVALVDPQGKTRSEAEATLEENPFFVANVANQSLLPNWTIESNNEHRSRGLTERTNSLITTVSCTVTEVLDNGNVRIQGLKQVTVNREDSTIQVAGIVRARDVSPANTVDSSRIAGSVIRVSGRGPLWNNQRRGLFTRIIDWISPF